MSATHRGMRILWDIRLYKVIQHRGQNIDDQHTAEAERQQTFGADASVKIQIVAGIIPPTLAIVGDFQIITGKIFNQAADGDG